MTLSREEILTMEPGRILDAKVAEFVMGLDMVDGQLPQLPRYFLSDYEKTIHRDVPLYSSDISAAWEVVTHLMSDYKDVIVQCVSFEVNKLFDCAIYEHEKELAVTSMLGSAPEAICKAALLAVLNL